MRTRWTVSTSMVTVMFMMVAMTSLPLVRGHGRLMEPPSRSSMWRFGFPTPHNYDDNALNCGGLNVQWYVNSGKCGVCGDPWDQPPPRDNEAGGLYGKGIITRTYTPGQIIDVRVEITANHKGWFEFRLCEHNDPTTPITHLCLEQHLLPLADGSGTRHPIDPNARNDNLRLKLPDGVTCSQCVLQWKWHGGNNYGSIQEEFYGCSDIAIGNTTSVTAAATHKPTRAPTQQPTPLPTAAQTIPPTSHVSPGGGGLGLGSCHAIAQFAGVPDLERYCAQQCPLGNCPPSYCACSSLPVTTAPPKITTAPPKITTAPPKVTTAPPKITTAPPKITTAPPKITTAITTAPPKVTTSPPKITTAPPRVTTAPPQATTLKGMVCVAIGVWQGVPELDLYCNEQCPVGNCPSQCSCTTAPSTSHSHTPAHTPLPTAQPTSASPALGCWAIGSWQGDVAKDQWCNTNCPIGLCPTLNCRCGPTVTSPAQVTSAHITSAHVTSSASGGNNGCHAVGPWVGVAMLEEWCKQTCPHYPGCDPHYCLCAGTPSVGPLSSSSPTPPITTPTPTTPTPAPVTTKRASAQCHAVNGWAGNPDLDYYCQQQCNSGGPCPPEYCSCGSAPATTATTITTTTTASAVKCYAINSWAGSAELDFYCQTECRSGFCPPQYCACGPVAPSGTTAPPKVTTAPPPVTTAPPKVTTAPLPVTMAPGGGGSQQGSTCHAVGTGQGIPELETWCRTQCALGNCPPVYCAC